MDIKTAAIPRAAYEYQDLAGIEVLLRQYRDPGLFKWVLLEADDTKYKSLDDVVAARTDGTFEFVQVKFTVDSERYELDWPWLLAKTGAGTSMLGKWSKSLARVSAMGPVHSACLKTNRSPSAEFAKCLNGSRVTLDLLDEATRATVEAECGGADAARDFFGAFDFLGAQPDFEEYEQALRDQVVPADTDPLGWIFFRHHVRTWAINKNQPSHDGKILREHVAQVINKRRPQPLRQDFIVPDGYLPPDAAFDDEIRARLETGANPVTVLWGTPGRGKSTYLSYLTLTLQEAGAAVLRHHYFLPAEDSVADRTSFTDIAASLIEQLGARHPDAMAGVSDDDREFRRSVMAAAENLASEGKRLYIVIDGLDHVWRDSRRVDQLNHLFNELLPVPPNVSLIIGTQRVPDDQLPSKLLTLSSDGDWCEIPAMDQAVVHRWLAHLDEARQLLLRFDPTPDRRSELISEIADALFEISRGHPLHLIYAYEELVRSGHAISADDVRLLPPCPDGDIRTYYQGLWVRLSATAKNALNMLAGSGFYWPSLGIRQVLGDFHEIDHLLEPRRFGMVPFHSSVFAWVRERNDHDEAYRALLPRVIAWLESDAPEYWKWGWLWLTKAKAGDFTDLLAGVTRDWVVDSLSRGWPVDQIECMLAQAEEKTFRDGNLSHTVSLRSLKTRVSNASAFQARDFSSFQATALAISQNHEQALNLIDAPYELTDDAVGAVARFGPEPLRSQTLLASFNELARRINTWIELRHRPYGEFTRLVDQLLTVSALMGEQETRRVLSFILGFETPEPQVARLIHLLGSARNLAGIQLVLETIQGGEWIDQRVSACDELIRCAGLLGADAGELIPKDAEAVSPFAACWFLFRGREVPAHVHVAAVPENLIKERYAHGANEDVTSFFYDSFWSALHAGLCANGNGYSLVPRDLGAGDPAWIPQGLEKLEQIARNVASGSKRADFAAVYAGSEDLRQVQFQPSSEAARAQYVSFCDALRRIATDLHLVGSTAKGEDRVPVSVLAVARKSLHWSDEIWIAKSAAARVPLLDDDAAALMLAEEASKLQSTVVEFSERSERWTQLAGVARIYRDPMQSSYIVHAAECLVGYGWRKDLGALDVLDAVSELHARDPAATRGRLEALVPIVNVITEFTDGDETNHVRSGLIDVVAGSLPAFLPSLYEYHLDNDEHSYADECLIEFVKTMDLSLAESRALARTLVDSRTLKALESRATSDELARQLLDQQMTFLGGHPPPPKRYEPSGADGQPRVSAGRDPGSFAVDEFRSLVSASDALGYESRGAYMISWLNHWREQGKATRALRNIQSYFESSEATYGADEILDAAFRVSLEVEGRDAAYPWLVRAHIHRNGWQSYFTSEEEAMRRLKQAAEHYPDRWLQYIQDTSSPAPYYRRHGHGRVIGYKYLVRFLVLVGQTKVASDVTDAFVRTLIEEVREQPIPSTPWFAPNPSSPSTALSMLLHRLKWPVPTVRWRAAKGIRSLLQSTNTRESTTNALLDYIANCKYESEVCEILNILFLTPPGAQPAYSLVASSIQHPSILADALLERAFGAGRAIGGWSRTYSGPTPPGFEAGKYFQEHNTAHVPPVYLNHLIRLESSSGFPFVEQWAYEWKKICDSQGTHYTRYPYYFDDFSESRAGIQGQYWQRMREAYLSAYLRTLAFAVCEWGLPQGVAESYCAEMVYGVKGLFEWDPGSRPTWLADFPERAFTEEFELEGVARGFITAARLEGQRLVSLSAPVAMSVTSYAKLELGAYLVTSDYQLPADEMPYDRVRILPSRSFELNGSLSMREIEDVATSGNSGSTLGVCVELVPMPFGAWQGDVLSAGLKIPAPHVVGEANVRCTQNAIELVGPADDILARTLTWNDQWSPSYPRGGNTRCGIATLLDETTLNAATLRLQRNLAWYVTLRSWTRQTDFGDYVESRRSAFFLER
ncbi:ATP-binding protein [uncultured Xanthomonas sp.]|uniref:ATP-binding protein n=1 Tax=uncultured Xanthomonas sp. TaxID=152831 RepID=UPI0025FC0109|nr:ATP-binding protein [uncultured Xanthomonas sp.]